MSLGVGGHRQDPLIAVEWTQNGVINDVFSQIAAGLQKTNRLLPVLQKMLQRDLGGPAPGREQGRGSLHF